MNYEPIFKGIKRGLLLSLFLSMPIAKAIQAYITPTRPALVEPVEQGPKKLAAIQQEHRQYVKAIRQNLTAHYKEPFSDIEVMRVSWDVSILRWDGIVY